ncbi:MULTISPECIES: hypothetical protein [unclassified Methylobacterium]|jgi:hypothetical protein|uniref:hypothetical protein n=1 Tax=unclassified Methylobacterium TaxID=2615210 RepID=UPI00135587B9|nr:hypothetical protein [Methylobacterium sp. 2A]MWV22098.1 hypothetical protein [Methylobacterium sp. 2A]
MEVGDEVSIVAGIVVSALGLWLRPHNRSRERFPLLLANGIAVGPLMLIMLSPLPSLIGWNADFLDIAMNEGRITIFWAAAFATAQLLIDVFSPPNRHP